MEISVALLLELGVILTVLTVLGTAARRFALSPIPLYLLAGLALGEGGIAPVPAANEFLQAGASIGVVLLLLTLGVEFSISRVRASLRTASAVGVGRRRAQRDPGRRRGLAARARTPSGSSPWPASPISRRPASSPGCSTTWAAWATGKPPPCCRYWCSRTSRWRPTCRCSPSSRPAASLLRRSARHRHRRRRR